jgi:hypothetical protein
MSNLSKKLQSYLANMNQGCIQLKKRIAVLILLFSLLSAAVSAESSSGTYKGYSQVHIEINGAKVLSDIPGINLDGTTMVPLRVISEKLGAQVKWNEDTSTVSILSNDTQGSPQLDPKAAVYLEAIQLYAAMEQFGQDISKLSESLGVAQEQYKAANTPSILNSIKEIYIKHLTDKSTAYNFEVTSLLKKTQEQNVNVTDMLKTLYNYNGILESYGFAVDALKQYYAENKPELLTRSSVVSTSAYDNAMRESINCYNKKLEYTQLLEQLK